ncbi:MAG TPA: cation:proton antiporter [Steroidobacteraceae bacterium]|nr:cation:proton antiporter [Steroidobacteraceae bacterium]
MATPGTRLDLALMRRPALAAVVALALGTLLGPLGLRVLRPQMLDDGVPIESVSEIALLICLFCLGLRLRMPMQWRLWRIPLRLATLTMLATAALAAAAAHLMFDMSLAQALLLGAIVAPTDSVLAAEAGAPAEGEEAPSFVLSAESGINNGLATVMVLLVLGLMGLDDSDSAALSSISLATLWAAAGGAAVGWLMGACSARWITLLDPERQTDFLEETLVFAAAAIAYGAALAIRTDGFIAVFAAGVALSHGGRVRRPMRNRPLMPRVLRISARLERLAWLAVILVLGTLIASVELHARMLVFAAVLLLVIRPLAVRLGLGSVAVPEAPWRVIAWFPARGVACLYCLAFAVNHGLSGPFARQLSGVTLVVVVCSILAGCIGALPLSRPTQPAL